MGIVKCLNDFEFIQTFVAKKKKKTTTTRAFLAYFTIVN